MTHVQETRASQLARETCTCVIPTCSKIFLARVSHIKQSVFYFAQVSPASFWCEFLVRVPCVSVIGFTMAMI